MNISMSLPLTIPTIVDQAAKDQHWYTDTIGNACVVIENQHYTLFRVTPFRTPEIVKRLVEIHNENLLIGMTDEVYNKQIMGTK